MKVDYSEEELSKMGMKELTTLAVEKQKRLREKRNGPVRDEGDPWGDLSDFGVSEKGSRIEREPETPEETTRRHGKLLRRLALENRQLRHAVRRLSPKPQEKPKPKREGVAGFLSNLWSPPNPDRKRSTLDKFLGQ